MEIKTKFNIGDFVWADLCGSAKVEITAIDISILKNPNPSPWRVKEWQ